MDSVPDQQKLPGTRFKLLTYLKGTKCPSEGGWSAWEQGKGKSSKAKIGSAIAALSREVAQVQGCGRNLALESDAAEPEHSCIWVLELAPKVWLGSPNSLLLSII